MFLGDFAFESSENFNSIFLKISCWLYRLQMAVAQMFSFRLILPDSF